jgi:hypothetical protein
MCTVSYHAYIKSTLWSIAQMVRCFVLRDDVISRSKKNMNTSCMQQLHVRNKTNGHEHTTRI